MGTKDLNEARIYVGTYAKYNNGSLQGEWVELSDFYDLDGFMERCAEIHEDEEEPEYMFQAWEEIPDGLIDEGHLEENFFELRDELDRLNNKEKEAFWIWVEGNNTQLTQDAYSITFHRKRNDTSLGNSYSRLKINGYSFFRRNCHTFVSKIQEYTYFYRIRLRFASNVLYNCRPGINLLIGQEVSHDKETKQYYSDGSNAIAN